MLNDIEMTAALINDLKTPQSCPSDLTGLVIQAISGSTIQFTSNIGSNSAWIGGVLTFTSGDAIYRSHVIADSGTNFVTLVTRMHEFATPEPGDTVTLSGGPLAKARVLNFEPRTVQSDIKAGKKYFVVVSALSGEEEWSTIGGNSQPYKHRGAVDSYHFEVVGWIPNKTGISTEADTAAAINELPILKEQIKLFCWAFRANSKESLFGSGAIAWGYTNLELPGSTESFKAVFIEFDVKTKG